jgi:XTP/dITP diphosphohydrolase
VQFEGRVIGKIVEPRRKADTDPFDWDAIFEPTVPEAGGMTFAEMGHELKNKLSHRRRAVDLLGAYLTSKIRLTDTGSKVIDLSPEADFE